jgi:hypothetical protein
MGRTGKSLPVAKAVRSALLIFPRTCPKRCGVSVDTVAGSTTIVRKTIARV